MHTNGVKENVLNPRIFILHGNFLDFAWTWLISL